MDEIGGFVHEFSVTGRGKAFQGCEHLSLFFYLPGEKTIRSNDLLKSLN